MPQIFHDPPTVRIVQLGVEQPLSNIEIIVQRSLVNPGRRDRKLSTAGTLDVDGVVLTASSSVGSILLLVLVRP